MDDRQEAGGRYARPTSQFYDHHRTRAHRGPGAEGYNKTYGIVHPSEQWASNREIRLSPFNARERDLGAVFFEAAGWERPYWYASNEPLLAEYGDRVMPRAAEWESRWWSPIINAEHLAMRDRVAMVDLSAFAIFDVTGPGAMAYLQGLIVAQADVPVGTGHPHAASQRGRRDLRRPHDHAAGPRWLPGRDRRRDGDADKKWFIDHLPADGSAQLFDATSAWTTVGVWGPAPATSFQATTADDVSHGGFPFATCRTIEIDGVRALASDLVRR